MSTRSESALSESALISTILDKDIGDPACIRMAMHISLNGVQDVNDIGMSQEEIDKINAVIELGRRIVINSRISRGYKILEPRDVVNLMGPIYQGLTQEVFYALYTDTKGALIKMHEISRGTLDACIVHPREVYREAVRLSASSVIVTHNHPSGDPTPSGADKTLTNRLAQAGKHLGIELLDHVILGGGEYEPYASMKDLDLMQL